ncbi:MAG: hypothetical protein JSS96_03015, partial [Bacteroidetes bacterium]|nr:hypothetical protein [Bacteroidota bacterium]
MKLKSVIYVSLVMVMICIMPKAKAQGPGFGGDTQDTPIDGGVSLLIAGGAMYGVKKIRDARKKDTDK